MQRQYLGPVTQNSWSAPVESHLLNTIPSENMLLILWWGWCVTIIGGHDASLGGGRTGDRWALTLVSEVAPGLTLTIVPCTLITLHLTCNTGHQQTRSETLKHFNKFLEKRTYTRKKKFRRRCESILDQWCTKDLQTNIKQYLGQFARLIISIGTKINSCKGQTVCLILMWKWKWMWQIIEYWLVSNEIQSSRKSLVILNIFNWN